MAVARFNFFFEVAFKEGDPLSRQFETHIVREATQDEIVQLNNIQKVGMEKLAHKFSDLLVAEFPESFNDLSDKEKIDFINSFNINQKREMLFLIIKEHGFITIDVLDFIEYDLSLGILYTRDESGFKTWLYDSIIEAFIAIGIDIDKVHSSTDLTDDQVKQIWSPILERLLYKIGNP